MYVYIIFGNTYKRTPKVTLDFEKCVPCVGTYKEDRVDPAQWFKVQVVGSILVNCERKMVYWTCEEEIQPLDTQDLLDQFQRQESLFQDGSGQEIDPDLEELFETAQHIFQDMSPDITGDDTKTLEELVRMLHVFILPEIEFQEKDRGHVKHVLDVIEKEHENIEMLIQMNIQMKKNSEEILAKQRKAFLMDAELDKVLKETDSDRIFLQYLLKHTEKDIKRLENDIRFTFSADNLPADPEAPDVKIVNLEAKKLMTINELESKISARKVILTAIKNGKTRKRKKRHSFWRSSSKSEKSAEIQNQIDKYMAETKELEKFIYDLNGHINTKVKLASIREATALTCSEIERDGSSFGYHCMRGSNKKGIGVLEMIETPKNWSTLKDQIEDALETNQSNLKMVHEQFCSKLKETCKDLKEGPNGYCFVNSEMVDNRSQSDEKEHERTQSDENILERRQSDENVHERTENDEKVHERKQSDEKVQEMTQSVEKILVNERTQYEEKIHERTKRNVNVPVHERTQRDEKVNETTQGGEKVLQKSSTYWLNRSISIDECKDICKDVIEHTDKMAQQLEVAIASTDKVDENLHKNVYICYEEYLSKEVMPCLCEVYEQSFQAQCKSLSNWIENYAKTELDAIDNTMNKLFPNPNDGKTHELSRSRLVTLVDNIYGQTENLAESFDKAWKFITRNSQETDTSSDVTSMSDDSEISEVEKQTTVRSTFQEFFTMITEENSITSLFGKLRKITKAMHFVADKMLDIQGRNNRDDEISTDDILDVVILLLCEMDSCDLLKLYAHLNIIYHLSPHFLQGSKNEYSVITFVCAFQHLFERLDLHERLLKPA